LAFSATSKPIAPNKHKKSVLFIVLEERPQTQEIRVQRSKGVCFVSMLKEREIAAQKKDFRVQSPKQFISLVCLLSSLQVFHQKTFAKEYVMSSSMLFSTAIFVKKNPSLVSSYKKFSTSNFVKKNQSLVSSYKKFSTTNNLSLVSSYKLFSTSKFCEEWLKRGRNKKTLTVTPARFTSADGTAFTSIQ
jgi:hypothetical protein